MGFRRRDGESLEECARRPSAEGLAELGVAVGQLRFLCVSNIVAYGKHYLDIEFLGDILPRGKDQQPQPVEPGAFSESSWFPLDQLPQPLFLAVRYALDSLRTGRYYYTGD